MKTYLVFSLVISIGVCLCHKYVPMSLHVNQASSIGLNQRTVTSSSRSIAIEESLYINKNLASINNCIATLRSKSISYFCDRVEDFDQSEDFDNIRIRIDDCPHISYIFSDISTSETFSDDNLESEELDDPLESSSTANLIDSQIDTSLWTMTSKLEYNIHKSRKYSRASTALAMRASKADSGEGNGIRLATSRDIPQVAELLSSSLYLQSEMPVSFEIDI